ncbi:MAG: TonB-dependent receptor [Saprospiraceae bacterium]|nr:TonB-dependent receptor [Saprospiraceae bacterium]
MNHSLLPMFSFLRKALGSTLMCCMLCQMALAQYYDVSSKGKISGIVRDMESGEPLPLVNIQIADTENGTSSELDGTFEIASLNPGKYKITATYIGYQEEVLENVEVTAGANQSVAFELIPTAMLAGEVIITATRQPQAVKLAPASVAIVTSQQMREKNVTTFDQAFDEVPGVVVTRSSGANVQALSIRGASEVAGGGIGNRVLLLIDGRPAISPESGGALWNLVPVNSIERIEVVKGAYSSLYGSSAMGGVVNVITQNPSPEAYTRVHLNYGAYGPAPKNAEYSRYNDFYTAEISTSHSRGRFSYLFDGGWKHNDGHREKSGFDLLNFYTKMAYRLNGNRHIQFSANANYIHNDTPATWLSRRQAYSVAEHRKDDYQDKQEYNADLYYYALPNARVKYSTRFFYYHNFSKYTFDSNPGNDSTNVNTGKQLVAQSSVRTQRLGNVSQVDWFASDRHAFVAGIEVKLDRVVGLPDTVLYGEHEAGSFAAYLQDEIKLSPKLTANLGARVDHYRIMGDFSETNFSPKLAGVYQINDDFSVRMLLAQAFRTPSIAERYIKFEQGGGLSFRPNPTLKSEKLIFSAEVGSKMKIASNTSLDVAVFYNRYNDLISYQQLSKPLEPLLYEVINLKKAVMQGFEVSLSQAWKNHLRVNVGYTYLDARDVSDGRLNDDLAYKYKHTFSASATGYYSDFTLNINSRYRSAIKEVFIYPGNEPGAVFLLNAKLSWKPTERQCFYLAIDNIGDAQYEELERYRMPGRSFTGGVVFGF